MEIVSTIRERRCFWYIKSFKFILFALSLWPCFLSLAIKIQFCLVSGEIVFFRNYKNYEATGIFLVEYFSQCFVVPPTLKALSNGHYTIDANVGLKQHLFFIRIIPAVDKPMNELAIKPIVPSSSALSGSFLWAQRLVLYIIIIDLAAQFINLALRNFVF